MAETPHVEHSKFQLPQEKYVETHIITTNIERPMIEKRLYELIREIGSCPHTIKEKTMPYKR